MASVFGATGWPLATTITTLALILAMGQIILVIVYKKTIPKDGFLQFMIEGGLMVILSVTLIIRYNV